MTRRPATPGRHGAAAGKSRRRALSQDAILGAALAIAQREGVEALSIRKLAAALGVTPMAVYHHFRNKQEILVGVIDRVVGEAAVTAHGVPRSRWQDWLRATFAAMHRALVEQPGVIPLLTNSLRAGPSALRVLDEVLGVLLEAGLERAAAVRGFRVLISYTVGAASLQAAALAADREQSTHGAATGGEASAELPHLAAVADVLVEPTAWEPFASGFEDLLAGLAPPHQRGSRPSDEGS
jgi:AcrR family transcriptional regulator